MNYGKKIMFVTLLALATSQQGFAAKGKYQKMHYGMSGCGVFTLLNLENSKVHQFVKSVADNWFQFQWLNTFAMTSGTSNCVNMPHETARNEQEVFVAANFNSLSKEAAQGEGEHLAALAEVMGCDHQKLATLSQANQAQIFATADGKQVVEKYRALIQQEPVLAGSCERI